MKKERKTDFKKYIKAAMIIIVLAGMAVSAYFIYYYSVTCELNDESCFSSAEISCRKASFIRESDEFVTSYNIFGESNDKCRIDIKILQVKKGASELEALENLGMSCYIPLNTQVKNPESDMNNCNGRLKEQVQDIIIQRMHSQLIENIGQVSRETTKVL